MPTPHPLPRTAARRPSSALRLCGVGLLVLLVVAPTPPLASLVVVNNTTLKHNIYAARRTDTTLTQLGFVSPCATFTIPKLPFEEEIAIVLNDRFSSIIDASLPGTWTIVINNPHFACPPPGSTKPTIPM